MQTPAQIHRGVVVSALFPSLSAHRYSPQLQHDTPQTRWLKPAAAILSLALVAPLHAQSTSSRDTLPSPIVSHHYLVVYRNAIIPTDAEARAISAGARLTQRNPHFGIAAAQSLSTADDATTMRRLAAQPNVEYVLHDRLVTAHRLHIQPILHPTFSVVLGAQAPYDTYYTSPQGWAVQQVGGYGNNVPGGPAIGPWNTTMGKGVRIAILDSGVDSTHPDIAPNLALNISEINQSVLPSPCDDGTPQDQTGHGTWTASLAAAAIGPGTGQVIGVAPAATLLNIKVLERLPASISGDGSTLAASCTAGEATGLLSWVMQGIEDAVTNRADIISLSLGTIVDMSTGDGAGLKAAFDQVTYAASQAGVILIAAAGNDGYDLSDPRYMEIPAQSRGVLAIVASTNLACAENLASGATCTPGPITLPTTATMEPHSTLSPHPVAATPLAPTSPSPDGSEAPAAPATPQPWTAHQQTPPTATDASTSATRPTFKP